MRSPLRTLLLATMAFAAVVAFFVAGTLPPRALQLQPALPDALILGGYHIHTSRSDGSGTVDEVARAASRAGLTFIVLTDHGDGTRVPDPPTYRHGVLCIDAVEVNSASGHVVALGLAQAAPYSLAGPARDVIDDIHRLGGVAVLAHPDSPSPALRWRGSDAGFDGVEWLNADSEWRDEPPTRLALALLRATIRSPEVIASLFVRPAASLGRWDVMARRHPVFGLAALDAHAKVALRGAQEPEGMTLLARPSYESMFRTAAVVAALDQPLSASHDAAADAARVVAALTSGRSYSIVRALAEPAALEFSATQGGVTVAMGARIPESDLPVTFRAAVPQALGVRLALLRDGHQVTFGQGSVTWSGPGRPAVYRVEVYFPGAAVPWIASNPITVGSAQAPPSQPPLASPQAPITVPLAADRWTVERNPSSTARLAAAGGELQMAYRLGDGIPAGQYAALVTSLSADAGVDRVQFVGRASRPTRVSVQVRLPGGKDGQRWRQSAYLDATPRLQILRLQDFEPVDITTSRRPVSVPLSSLLFVIDTVNTRPGTEGEISISEVALGLPAPLSQ